MSLKFYCLLLLALLSINLNAQNFGLVLDNFSHRNGSVGTKGLYDDSAFSESRNFSLSAGVELGIPLDSTKSILVQAIFQNSRGSYDQEASNSPTFLESSDERQGAELNLLIQRIFTLPSNRVNIQYAIGLTASMDFGRNRTTKQTNFSEDSVQVFELERVTDYPSDWSYGILLRTGFGINIFHRAELVPHISMRLLHQHQKGSIETTLDRKVFGPNQSFTNTSTLTPIKKQRLYFLEININNLSLLA